jgi:predicted dithiol-disulfide oxidoreductase (DUF899 family)
MRRPMTDRTRGTSARWSRLWNLFDLTPEGRPDWDEELSYP